MGADKIEGRTQTWERWAAYRHGDEEMRRTASMPDDAVAVVRPVYNVAYVALDKTDAARLACFLLESAGVDLVGAARKVVETREARDAAKGKDGFDNAHLDFNKALTGLTAELAKLEGGA